MHMNWLEISIGIVFLICIITGLVRGAIRIMVSLIATIVTFAIVFFATPYVSQAVEKYTPLDDMIKQKVVSTMADAATSAITGGGTVSGQGLNEAAVKKALKAAGVSEEMLNRYGISISDIVNGKIDSSDLAKYGISANVLDGLTGGSGSSVENVIENADIPESLQETMIKSADIPEVFKNLLLKNNNKEMYDEETGFYYDVQTNEDGSEYRGLCCQTGDQYYSIHTYVYCGDGNYKSGCVCPGYCIRTTGNRFL